MESLYLLIPIALVFCVIAIKLLLWAISSGQYDDLDNRPTLRRRAAADRHGTLYCQLVARHGISGTRRRKTVATGAASLIQLAATQAVAARFRAGTMLGPDALRPDLQQPGLGGYGTECFYLGADDAAVRAGYIARYAVDQLWGGAIAGVAATARIKSGDRFTAYRLGVMDAVYHCCT
jgi:cbb3-type cytochrome oxidase maturation protein